MKDKVILITGASKGLGRAMAQRFSRAGARLVLAARSLDRLETLGEEIRRETGRRPMVCPCDISREEGVEKMMAAVSREVGRLDVLVNNAGIGTFLTAEQMPGSRMRQHFEVNVFGVYYTTRGALPLLKKSRSGYILNIGSFYSRVADAETGVYAATKFALDGFSRGLRQELKPFGTKVGLFVAGPMSTDFHRNVPAGATPGPGYRTVAPAAVAAKLERMILTRKRELIFPWWLFQALRLRIFMTG